MLRPHYSEQMHPHTVTLCYLNAYPNVLISRQQNCIGYSFIACELDEVCNNEGVDALLLSLAVYEPEAELHIVALGEPQLLQ